MKRKTFDALLSTGGLVVAILLVAAGALLGWANSFVADNVKTQLSEQQITFPSAAAIKGANDPEITKYVTPYAGKQLTTGKQAEVFADHYIKVHIEGSAKAAGYAGKTYATLGPIQTDLRNKVAAAETAKDPALADLQTQLDGVNGLRDTMFKGETLRGLLLNAYAFGKMGEIAGIAAIASFIGAGVMLLLSALGFWHLRRVSPEAEVLPHLGARTPAPVEL
jgi:hypothetical protein